MIAIPSRPIVTWAVWHLGRVAGRLTPIFLFDEKGSASGSAIAQ